MSKIPPGGREGPPIRREGLKRGVYLLPNLFTTGSLLLGFLAIVRSMQHDYIFASWAIFASGICDALDGRVARLARAESEFGIEYDSLVDLVAFGMAPSILMYTWALHDFPRYGWVVAFMFVACGAMRLARFNVQASTVERNYFQGLPIPMAGGMLLSTVIFYHAVIGPNPPVHNIFMIIMTVVVSLLMVSNVRYRSFKKFDMHSRWSFFALVVFALLIALLALEPQIMVFVIASGYIIMGLVEEVIVRNRRDERERRRAKRILKQKIRFLPDYKNQTSQESSE